MSYETTMRSLLTDLRRNLKNNASNVDATKDFSKIRTWRRGVLPPTVAFPALCVTPVNESVTSRMSGGRYNVIRGVEISVFHRSAMSKVVMSTVMQLTDAVRRYLWENPYVNDSGGLPTCINADIPETVFGESPPAYDALLHSAKFTASFHSREDMPGGRTVTPSQVQQGTPNNFLDQVFSDVLAYKNSTLAKVRAYEKGTIPPQLILPCVTITEPSETTEHYEVGMDRYDKRLHITVWTRMTPQEKSLDLAIDLVEALKDIVQDNNTWSGWAVDSFVSSIDYGTFTLEKQLIYSVVMEIPCRTARTVV